MEFVFVLLLLVVVFGGFPCFAYVMNKSDLIQNLYLISWIALGMMVVVLGSMQF